MWQITVGRGYTTIARGARTDVYSSQCVASTGFRVYLVAQVLLRQGLFDIGLEGRSVAAGAAPGDAATFAVLAKILAALERGTTMVLSPAALRAEQDAPAGAGPPCAGWHCR